MPAVDLHIRLHFLPYMKEKQRRRLTYQFDSSALILTHIQEDAMLKRIGSYVSYENEPFFLVALAFLFYGAMALRVV
jgi:hypothetical protein